MEITVERSSLRKSASFLATSSTNSSEAFPRYLREEDDEEPLQWAAIERLPTCARLKKGFLVGSRGKANEVDVQNLTFDQRVKVLERLFKLSEEDNDNFFCRLRNRIDRVGIRLPSIEVRYEELNVSAEAYVGSRALPTIYNYYVNMVEDVLSYLHLLPNRKKQIRILKDVNGIIKPGRMTLLLGPPRSGKTSLLLALAGMLNRKLKFSGKVTYNGHEMKEFVPQKSAAYINQYDLHIPEMTVRETLAFSARCQGVGSEYDMLMELLRREKAANIKPDPDIDLFMKAAAIKSQGMNMVVDYVLKILGLDVCADSVIGDGMVRAISGGKKKLVTIGEMLVGPVKVLLMDEILTGLANSTTFQVVNVLKRYAHILDGTVLISLLQPQPETFNLFDDIVLLSHGQIVYQGPREHVLEFFESMGFRCPERKGVADFLQEVISKTEQEQYWFLQDEPYRYVTVEEFVEAFNSFHVGMKLRAELSVPFDKTKSHRAALTTKKYGVGGKELLKACMSREFLLMKRSSGYITIKLVQLAITAFVIMTAFIRTHSMHKDSITDGGLFMSCMFFLLYISMYTGFAEMSATIAKLPVFYKQRSLLLYPPWAYAIPSWLVKVPISIIEMSILVIPTYYVIGYDPNVGRYFKQYVVVMLIKVMASAFYRFVGAVCRTPFIANAFSYVGLIIYYVLDSFVLSRDSQKKWWTWGYWSSPLMYAQHALAVNEFHGKSWSHPISPNSTQTLGIAVLLRRGIFPGSYWYWIGIGTTIGFTLVYIFLFTMALTYLNPIVKRYAFIVEENDEEDGNGKGNGNGNDMMIRRVSSASTSGGSTSIEANQRVLQRHRRKGMILPFEQHSITFDTIRYFVDMPQEMKRQGVHEDRLELLHGVSGSFRPFVLTALMGVSGSGKTTLMDVLAGRKTGGDIQGTITISGYQKKQDTFTRIFGYCEQNDVHSPHVTVYESLIYSAWLRLPPEVNSETRKIFIDEVMELVELSPLREAMVGLPGVNGLSLEQRKRLTVAVELMANPSIIFMDEPTSGLDARAAAIVMRAIRNTVDTGRTVVCTIRQPSIDIFESFEELFLMAQCGKEIYVGPLGFHSQHLIKYFEEIEGIGKIKNGYNPAIWVLEVSMSAESELGIDLNDVYKNSELYRRNKEVIKELSTPTPGSKELYFPTKYPKNFFTQWKACLWKQNRSYWHNTSYTAFRFFFSVLLALILGSRFWNLGSERERQQDLLNITGAMYGSVYFISVINCLLVIPEVSIERTVFYRERAARMYSVVPYCMAQVMIELPYLLVQAMVYGAIIYRMIGFEWKADKFFWYIFFTYSNFLYSIFYGMMMVALTPNQGIVYTFCSTIFTFWSLFAGFILPSPKFPGWWRWCYRITPISWVLHGLIASQFGDIQDIMDTNETVESFIRRYYDFKHEFVGIAAVVIVAFSICFALIFVFSLKVFNFQKR